MGDELKLGLYIIGIMLIGGIFAHGLWSIRKNKEQLRDFKEPQRNEPEFGKNASSAEELDNHGVGQPRPIGGTRSSAPEREEPSFSATGQSVEPSIESMPNVDVEPQGSAATDKADETEAQETEAPAPSEVLIIHLSMPENESISGASLLPDLISMGFKYGEMDIFHRHEDAAGNGAKLFSVANMYNPGTFDVDNMEQLSLRGLSLFMTLPCSGEPLQNFNMMHNAAKKLCERFGGQLLDANRSALTVQTVRHYVEKIREFERQQLING